MFTIINSEPCGLGFKTTIAGFILLCSWTMHFTVSVTEPPLPREHKWTPLNCKPK